MTTWRKKRLEIEASGSAFARKLGINQAQYCIYEKGQMRVPEKWRPVIAKALQAKESDLFDERGFAR